METTINDLKNKFKGEIILPHDQSYDEARQVWNGLIDKRPLFIARCRGTADVMDIINYARENNTKVSVRGGGHNVAGHAVCDDGIVIDLSRMRGIHVDPDKRIARVEGGATWADLDRETQVFGLATPGGVVSTTGIAGLTLGGGLGWLRKKHGLSIDNLLSVDIVTADGEFLTASKTENKDLFWAIRGGGGNFGVVTSFEYKLHKVGPTVMLCATMYPIEKSHNVLSVWHEFMNSSPDDVSSQALLWSIPNIDAFPEGARNQDVVIVAALYSGDADEGEKILQPLREIDIPVIDLSGQMPYTTAQSMFDPFFPKNERYYYFKSKDLVSFDKETMDKIIEGAKKRPVSSILFAIWHYGGEMNRIGREETAFGSRDTSFLLSVDAVWDDPQDSDSVIAWSRKFLKEMEPYSGDGMYVNFSGLGEEGDALVQSAYGVNYKRLTKIKAKYDPKNFFHANQNIKP